MFLALQGSKLQAARTNDHPLQDSKEKDVEMKDTTKK